MCIPSALETFVSTDRTVQGFLSQKKSPPPPRTIIGPQATAYRRVLRGVVFLWARYPCKQYHRPGGFPMLKVSETSGAGGEALHPYRGTSFIRNRHPVGPYSRTMPRVLGGS